MESKATTPLKAFTDARYKENLGTYVMEKKNIVGLNTKKEAVFIYSAEIFELEIIVCQNRLLSRNRKYYPIIVQCQKSEMVHMRHLQVVLDIKDKRY